MCFINHKIRKKSSNFVKQKICQIGTFKKGEFYSNQSIFNQIFRAMIRKYTCLVSNKTEDKSVFSANSKISKKSLKKAFSKACQDSCPWTWPYLTNAGTDLNNCKKSCKLVWECEHMESSRISKMSSNGTTIRKEQFWLKYYQKIPLDGV